MVGLNTTVKITLVTTSLLFSGATARNHIPSVIEISSRGKSIRVGDPLTLKLLYKFEQPQTSPHNGQARKYFRHHAYLDIEHENGDFSTKGYKLFPIDLNLEDSLGLEYSKYFLCFYHPGENRFLFPIPGRYSVTVRGWRNRSEPLDISVEPASNSEQLAINLLSDPNDYRFLEYGSHEDPEKRPERVSHLKQVVEQCEGTLLAKWAAARLGIEEAKELEAKYPAGVEFTVQYRQKKIVEPLVRQAQLHLSKALSLPDEFPIRERVLYELPKTEFIRGNYKKAFSLLDELGAKYPKGKYGKRASSVKEELKRLKERELEQSPKPPLGQASRPAALTVVVAAVAVGIVLIGLILVIKKKAISRSR